MTGPQTPPDTVFALAARQPTAPMQPCLLLTLPHSWLPAALLDAIEAAELDMPEYYIDLRQVLDAYLVSHDGLDEDAEILREVLVEWVTWLRTYALRLEQRLDELAPMEDA